VRQRDLRSVERFAALPRPAALPWLSEARESAWAALRTHGFPGSKDEAWKYTPARKILRLDVGRSPPGEVELSVPSEPRLVFVDGEVSGALSAPGLHARALSKGAAPYGSVGDGFEALNLAFVTDGAVVDVPDGVDGGVLHLVHHGTGGRLQAVRHRVRVGAGARLVLMIHWTGGGPDLTTAVTNLEVEGQLELVELQDASADAMQVHRIIAEVGAAGVLRSTAVSVGALVARTHISAALAVPGASASLDGLYLGRGSQQTDQYTHIDHVVSDCTSRERYKGILTDRARGAFTGSVAMQRDAQRSDSEQANHSLLLSDDAVVYTRPQLEIHADDVKAAHGATVGRLDAESTFYLQQRGLTVQQARSLLTWAFVGEIVDDVPAAVRPIVAARVRAWLEGVA
jgi:Fe-S cluster assembly protein SufD